MRLHRFYIEEKLAGKNETKISGEALLHQLKDVFRLSAGDQVIFFDGEGMDATFKIEMISKKEAVFKKEKEETSIMPEKSITLLMALIKKDNFELVLQKCTELGVSRFVPIMAERSEKKNLDIERAKRIIKEASEQCGRGDLPTIEEIKDLKEVLESEKNIFAFDGSGEELTAERIFKVLGPRRSAYDADRRQTIENSFGLEILIGPEGGWSEKELALFKEKNIPIYSLGSLTLRAETAAIVAAAKVLQ